MTALSDRAAISTQRTSPYVKGPYNSNSVRRSQGGAAIATSRGDTETLLRRSAPQRWDRQALREGRHSDPATGGAPRHRSDPRIVRSCLFSVGFAVMRRLLAVARDSEGRAGGRGLVLGGDVRKHAQRCARQMAGDQVCGSGRVAQAQRLQELLVICLCPVP
jgi:hypothetical protein